jgi:hypothetical protein
MPVAGTVQSTSNQARQLSDGNDQGTTLGLAAGGAVGGTANDKVGFFGVVSTQFTGNAQATLIRGQASGVAMTFASTQTPGNIASQTSSEVSMTVIGATASVPIISGDLLYVNKPSSQAGLIVGNVRVSGSNAAAVQFSNMSTTTITPTAAEKYGFVALRGIQSVTQVITPVAVASQSIAEQQFTVPGLRAGELVQVMKPTYQSGLNVVGTRVVSANTLGITYHNCSVTTTPITPTAEAYTIWSLGGLDANSPDIMIQANIGTVAGVLSTAGTVSALTLTGLATTDFVTGVTKPSSQAGLAIAQAYVSAANVLGIGYVNTTASTITPIASENYGIRLFRPAPAAPLVVYSATLTPSAIASQTTSEVGYTVTGVVASSAIWINKPSFTNNIGICGVRVSAANVIAVNYVNVSTAQVTPPTETYLIGNFQQAIPDAGNCFMQTVSLANQQDVLLTNAIRAALVGHGLIAGA